MKKLLSIDEVCNVTQVSKPTVYRKVKKGDFPAPIKVPTTATRGPKMVNRWEEPEVLDYCLRMNMHKQAVAEHKIIMADMAKEDHDDHWHEDIPPANPEPWYVRNHYAVMAAVGGLLAGLAVWLFR